MHPSLYSFTAREAVARIKPKNSISLIRPKENLCVVVGCGTGVAQPLRFGQIGFAAAQPVFGLLGFIDVDRQATPLDDASLPIAQRLTTSLVPTKLAVRP